mgnify:CR=1 FL=1
MAKKSVTPKPKEKSWANAILHRVYLGMKAPSGMAGLRLVWAIIGDKWVRLRTPVTNVKLRMRRSEWDKLPSGDRMPMRKVNASK